MKEKKRLAALLKRREIELAGNIDSSLADYVCRSVRRLNAIGNGPITVFIESNGGDIMHPALDIWSAFRASKAPIIGVVPRYAASFAVLVLQACGERRIYPFASIRLHPLAVRDFFVTDSNEVVLAELAKARGAWDEILGIYAIRMGRDVEEIRPLFVGNRRGRTYTAEQALREGLVDIIEKL